MSLADGPKRLFWKCLARCLRAGAALIRRRPGPTTADEWRAAELSYSHLGEDRVILTLLRDRIHDPAKGVYVDVGAFDPVFFSNTLLLAQYGWKGINIDANPDRVELLRQGRPRDVNLWAVVSNTARTVRYLRYPTAGLNRIVEAGAPPQNNMQGESPTQVDEVSTCTLTDLLTRHLPAGAPIDFLNVDCEGEDLNVLDSLDWEWWRPRVVAAEANSAGERDELTEFMRDRGYVVAAQILVTLIFTPADGVNGMPGRSRAPAEAALVGGELR